MQLFLHWDNHEATQSWTIEIPKSVKKCKKFICDQLQMSGLPHPSYIKFVKTVAGRHAYILLYTNPSTEDRYKIASQFENHFPVPEDGYRMWKWRTYWHSYTPWESHETNEVSTMSDMHSQFETLSIQDTSATDLEKKELEHVQQSDASEDDSEIISVYDYIMEETQMNKYHMKELYPLHSKKHPKHTSREEPCVARLEELCSALSEIDIQKV